MISYEPSTLLEQWDRESANDSTINEQELSGGYLKQETIKFKVELDNTLFLYYKFLGILGNSRTLYLYQST